MASGTCLRVGGAGSSCRAWPRGGSFVRSFMLAPVTAGVGHEVRTVGAVAGLACFCGRRVARPPGWEGSASRIDAGNDTLRPRWVDLAATAVRAASLPRLRFAGDPFGGRLAGTEPTRRAAPGTLRLGRALIGGAGGLEERACAAHGGFRGGDGRRNTGHRRGLAFGAPLQTRARGYIAHGVRSRSQP